MLTIPLFPLNLIVLPFEYLPLHIFEPRYKAMIKSSIEQDAPFGIIFSQDNEIYSKGCRVKVTEVYKEYKSGEYDILVKGVERFKVFDTITLSNSLPLILSIAGPDNIPCDANINILEAPCSFIFNMSVSFFVIAQATQK